MRNLILGGAQFGDSYGKFVKVTKMSIVDTEDILHFSKESGINLIDLALNYKNADQNLASTPASRLFEFTTKIHYVRGKEEEYLDLLQAQLTLLRIRSFNTIFIHNWFELSKVAKTEAFSFLKSLVDLDLTKKMGVSVYEVQELESIDTNIDVIQAPLSFINRQFLTSEKAWELNSEGVEFQARSIFHQGLLLNPSQDIATRFPEIESFIKFCSEHNLYNFSFSSSLFGLLTNSENSFK
jgi:aryl-alcohol dehydrogenase-like predicted oxidoreductase